MPAVEDAPAGCRDPRNALTFLVDDLASVGTSRPVVIVHHYCPHAATFEWDQAQINAYAAAISGYNVIAILYGHSHGTGTGTWQGTPTFNLGSPYYLSYNPDGRGHYTVFRITDEKLYAFDASWDPADPTSIEAPANGSRVLDLPSTRSCHSERLGEGPDASLGGPSFRSSRPQRGQMCPRE